ncbi:MAG: ATP synthase F1 subunit gamma [bacterium]
MATLRAIKKRIKSAGNIQQITKAMKMVSAAKLRKSQDRILAARPYSSKIAEVIDELIVNVKNETVKYPLLKENKSVKREALVLITADKGLCGSFNTNLVKEAMIKYKENPDISLFIVGKKGLDAFKKLGLEIEKFKFNDKNISWIDIEEISGEMLKNYIAAKYSKVTMIYSEFQTSLMQKIVKKQLAPVVFEAKKVANRDYIYEPGETEVLNALLLRYVKTQLYRAILESQTSEQGVRMVSMEMATNNAKDMIRALTLLANKTRQAQITKEILEIVSGAEAIK